MLTPWPPGPEERNTSTRRSSSRTTTSMSSTSGMTDTDANDVCRRFGGVERRDAHQPVDAGLALEVPVGVVAGDLEGRRLDPGLVAGQQVHDLDLVAAPLRPARVHAEQHLRPVLGLGAAGPGVDRDDGVLPVVLAREHDGQLELAERLAAPLEPGLDLRLEALVALLEGHLPEGAAGRPARATARRPVRLVRVRSLRSRISPWARRASSQKPAPAISASIAAMRASFAGEVKDAPGARRAAARGR